MNPFLRSTQIVNWDHPEVLALASYLSKQSEAPQVFIAKTFDWVCDHIEDTEVCQKAADILRASDVLVQKRGCCFAKSHLLAALLRANGISAGFAYQAVENERGKPSYRLHGLNTVYLPRSGWCDLDTMGHWQNIEKYSGPPDIRLSYPDAMRIKGVWPNPLSCVVSAFSDNLPIPTLYCNSPEINTGA
ncbi:transglutaminase-like domain-containing protein [Oceanospirillum sp.]|uniref:transglutaminase-like domain-containing protein n=1 Tax=Oceanospirillum sp. TaxID=2021254 RepID=UPI003A917059